MQYGYFDNDHHEYVITRPDVPVSWTNYLGVEDLCTVISHNAGGYTFYKSAEDGRLTRFRPNGVPLDRPGHYIYLRDDDTGEYWTLSWQPVGKDFTQAQYETRHGLSYSRFACNYQGIAASQTLFIPLGDDVELWDVVIRNESGRPRRLSVFSYVEFSYGHVTIDNQNFQMSLYASGSSYRDGVIEYDFFYEPDTFRFMTANFTPDSYDCLRDSFIGPYRTERNPLAVERGQGSRSAQLTGNHCGALHKRLELAAGEEARLVFMLGNGPDAKARRIREKYGEGTAVSQAFAALQTYWTAKRANFQCHTPHQGLNTMVNTWNLYQAETCVTWSRFASFIEVGGRTGLGFRDTAQDVMSVVHSSPARAEQRIRELLSGQVSAGYGLHLFDPEVFKPRQKPVSKVKLPTVVPMPDPADVIHGLEDTCADDHLWLVVSICEFVKETGNLAFFNDFVPFADGGVATVYDHLRRALDFSAQYVGRTGICQGLRADWNDCLNLGGGETSMVSFMHHWALQAFIAAAQALGRDEDVEQYTAVAAIVKEACERELWDGRWYIRGFTKDGLKIGSHASAEGKLFLNAQSWAVLSGVAAPERAAACLNAVDEHLSSPYGLHLLWPAYTTPNDDIGYVTRVYPGVKENAAIFSHPNPWAVIAECMVGNGRRAMKYYDAMLPYNQNDRIEIREAEPYSYCQFIMGRDHSRHGQARHPWLTGSGGWFYTAVTRHILGIQLRFDGLVVDPCIPADWPGFTVQRQWRGATFHITVQNPDGVEKGVRSVTLNGEPVHGPIPPQPAGSLHEVVVVMG
ncbi:MAG: N,N'-diacetylchitobiose phosphorylase [Chloroflexi bacterium]|nr:N,N'-diacetylchitobiose phosphorylase [Chloroflexota bacterium]MBP7045213.1 N,N'-diacetylchitobiose phosphorylase [Chloroflexota bacterium]